MKCLMIFINFMFGNQSVAFNMHVNIYNLKLHENFTSNKFTFYGDYLLCIDVYFSSFVWGPLEKLFSGLVMS